MPFGSQRGFPYTTDDGTVYGLRLDESNTELVNTGAGSLTPPSGVDTLPSNIHRRKVRLEAANGSTKTVVVLTRTLFDGITLGQSFAAPSVGEENPAGTSFVVTQKIPERNLRAIVSLDTGKTDGDNP